MELQTLKDHIWERYSEDLIAAQKQDILIPYTLRPDSEWSAVPEVPTDFEGFPSEIFQTHNSALSADGKGFEKEKTTTKQNHYQPMEKSQYSNTIQPDILSLSDILDYVVNSDMTNRQPAPLDNKVHFDMNTRSSGVPCSPFQHQSISPQMTNMIQPNLAFPQTSPTMPSLENLYSPTYLNTRNSMNKNNFPTGSSPVLAPSSSHSPQFTTSNTFMPTQLQNVAIGSGHPSVPINQQGNPHNQPRARTPYERFSPDSYNISNAPSGAALGSSSLQDTTLYKMENGTRRRGRIPKTVSSCSSAHQQTINKPAENHLFPMPSTSNPPAANCSGYCPAVQQGGNYPINENDQWRRMQMGCSSSGSSNIMPKPQSMSLAGPSHGNIFPHEMSNATYGCGSFERNSQPRPNLTNKLKQARKRKTMTDTEELQVLVKKRKELDRKMVECLCDKQHNNDVARNIITKHLYHTQTCACWLANDNCSECLQICEMVNHSSNCSNLNCNNVYCAIVAKSVTDLFSIPAFVNNFLKGLGITDEDMKEVFVLKNKK